MWQTVTSAFHQLTSLAPAIAALAVALYGCNLVLCALRWRAALWALGTPMGFRTATVGMLCSVFVNNITPARVAGDVFRIGWLKERARVDVGRGTASVAIDRLLDLAPLGFIGLLSLSTIRPYLSHLQAPLILAGAVAGLLVLAIIVIRRAPGAKARFAEVRAHIVGPGEKRGQKIAVGLALAALAWLADLARLSLIAHGFGVDLTVPQAALLLVLVLVGSLAPTVGGLGAVEGGLAAALVWFGVPTDRALAITLTERAISYWLSTAAGGLTLLLLGGRRVWTGLQHVSRERVA